MCATGHARAPPTDKAAYAQVFSPATPDASIELTGVGYDSQGGGVVVDGAPAQRATHPHIALVMEIGSVCNNADWEAQVRVLPLLLLLLLPG